MLHSQSRSKCFRQNTLSWYWKDRQTDKQLDERPSLQCYRSSLFHVFHELCDIPEDTSPEASNPINSRKHSPPPMTVGRITTRHPMTAGSGKLPSNTLYLRRSGISPVLKKVQAHSLSRYMGGECDALENMEIEERISKWQEEQHRLGRITHLHMFPQHGDMPIAGSKSGSPVQQEEDQRCTTPTRNRAKHPRQGQKWTLPFLGIVGVYTEDGRKVDNIYSRERQEGEQGWWKGFKADIKRRLGITWFGAKFQAQLMVKRVKEKKVHWRVRRTLAK